MHRWISGIAVAVVLLCVGVGCGGGSGDTTPEITKAQFVKKANFICADFNRERYAAAEKEFNPKQRHGSHAVGSPATEALETELEELGEKLVKEVVIPSLRKQLEKLESLGLPSGDEAKVEKILQNFDKGTAELEEEGYKGILGDQFDDFDEESDAYGLKCSFNTA